MPPSQGATKSSGLSNRLQGKTTPTSEVAQPEGVFAVTRQKCAGPAWIPVHV